MRHRARVKKSLDTSPTARASRVRKQRRRADRLWKARLCCACAKPAVTAMHCEEHRRYYAAYRRARRARKA